MKFTIYCHSTYVSETRNFNGDLLRHRHSLNVNAPNFLDKSNPTFKPFMQFWTTFLKILGRKALVVIPSMLKLSVRKRKANYGRQMS